jgi:glycosyltransferase involved in cell wall biosynthesis
MKVLKVLHICAVGFTVKNLLIPQIDYFLSQGLSVEIACSPGQEVEKLRQQGYVVHPIHIERRIDLFSNIRSIYNLVKLIQQNQYDIVHVHTPIASVLGRIAAKVAGIKTILYTAHGFYFHDITPPVQYKIFHTIETAAAKLTDLIFSVNYEDIEMIKRTHLCPVAKVRYVGGDGVDVDKFNPKNLTLEGQIALKKSLGIPDTAKPIIGTVGRLNKKKGSAELIEAIAKLRSTFPTIHALIVGGELSSDPDPFQSQLLHRIQTLGLEQCITLTGYREDVPELMDLMDIFTLPTFTHEGLPTVICEAMAMEKPVVATDIRGCREAVVNGATGYIVPPKNPDLLAEAIANLLQDPQKCRDMGLAGRQRVETEYDVRLVIQRLAAGYQELGILSV